MPNSMRRVPVPSATESMYGAPPDMRKASRTGSTVCSGHAPSGSQHSVDLDVRNSQFDPNSLRNRPDSGFASVYTRSVYGKGIYAPDMASQQEASGSGSGSQTQVRDSTFSEAPAGRSSYWANPAAPSTGRDSVAPPPPRTFVPLKGSSSIPTLRTQSIQTQPENFAPSAWAPPVPSLPTQYAPLKESVGPSPRPSATFTAPPSSQQPVPPEPLKKKRSREASRPGRTHERGDSAGSATTLPTAPAASDKASFEAQRLRAYSTPTHPPTYLDERAQAMMDIDLNPAKYRQAQALTVLETPEEVRARRAKMSGTRGRAMDNWRSMHVYQPADKSTLTRVIKDEDKVTTTYFIDVEQLSSRGLSLILRLPARPYTVEATTERGRTIATIKQSDPTKPVEFQMYSGDVRMGVREETMTMGKDGVLQKSNSFKGVDLYRWRPAPHGNMQCEHTVTGEVVAHFRPIAAVSKLGELKVNPAHTDVMDILVASAIARSEQLGVSKGFHPGRFMAKLFSGIKSAPPVHADPQAAHIALHGTSIY